MIATEVREATLNYHWISQIKIASLRMAVNWLREKQIMTAKIKVVFKTPQELPINRYKKKCFSVLIAKFFISANDFLCYAFHKRTGYRLFGYVRPEDIDYFDIMFVKKEDREAKRKVLAARLAKKIYPNTWTTLRKQLEDEPLKALPDSNLKPISFISKFKKYKRDYIKEGLEKAFKNRSEYYYRQEGVKRTYSIEARLCDDGIYRAWFSSEYAGCANGDYYLIINPTQAVFCETD